MHGENIEYGPSDGSQFHGMFGGYSMYHHCCCSRMLPLSRALLWRQMFMDKPKVSQQRNWDGMGRGRALHC